MPLLLKRKIGRAGLDNLGPFYQTRIKVAHARHLCYIVSSFSRFEGLKTS